MRGASTGPPELGGSEEQFRLLLECVADCAVFLLDPRGHVAAWNVGAGRMFGYEEGEVLGRHFALFFVPEEQEKGDPENELRAAETGRAGDDRWQVRKDGSRLWVRGATTALRDEQGGLRGYARVLRDHTERKDLEAELRRRTEQLAEAGRGEGKFLAVLAHELGNLFAPLSNGICVLRMAGEREPIAEKALGLLERQAERMARLVGDLLDVSCVRQGMVELRLRGVELAPVLTLAVETSRPHLDARKHELAVSLPAEPVRLMADPARLVQVFAHLLTNAAKYTEEGGRIRLTAAREGAQAVIRVRDNGVGMAAEFLPHVFNLFTQAEWSPGGGRGGLSIGLSLVKSLVELHGGTTEAHSDGPGQGSEFAVRLPVAEAVSESLSFPGTSSSRMG